MRIQILLLPSVMVGDDLEEPFALVFDQAEDGIYKELVHAFAMQCGAKTFVILPQTVEIVDRYAEPSPPPPQVHVGDLRIYTPEGFDPEKRSLMEHLPPEVRPLAAAVGIPDRPVDLRERASEWIVGFLAASDEDRVNCVALMLGAADDAIRCAVNHKAAEGDGQADV